MKRIIGKIDGFRVGAAVMVVGWLVIFAALHLFQHMLSFEAQAWCVALACCCLGSGCACMTYYCGHE